MKIYIPIFIFLGFGALAMAPQGLEAKTVEVEMTSDLRFVPAAVAIQPGDTIRWRNTSGMTHTTTDGYNCTTYGYWDDFPSLWDETVLPGQTFELVFTEAKVYYFYFSAEALDCESGMVGTITVEAASAMPLPESQLEFTLFRSSVPILSADPGWANPIGLGSISVGGDTLDIAIGTVGFSGPADVYFAVFSPQALGTNEILLFTGTTFVALSQAEPVPWIANTNGPLDQHLLGAISVSALPSGEYTLFFAMGPADSSLATYYLWSASFIVP
jgi:plastocyanin